uniref:Uncharacterized protein n=1 Tax=Steinernema glaseri TaxID=37863 RepID=A0A1I7YN78_9BILA
MLIVIIFCTLAAVGNGQTWKMHSWNDTSGNSTEEESLDSYVRVCANTAQFALFNYCQYPDQKSPCFTYDTPKFINSLLHRVVRDCCENKCTWRHLYSFCCFYSSCLNECYGFNYPSKMTGMRRPGRLFHTQRANMTSMEIENFLFDLTRPEERKRRRRHFHRSLDI